CLCTTTRPPTSTLFPYTTLFRSLEQRPAEPPDRLLRPLADLLAVAQDDELAHAALEIGLGVPAERDAGRLGGFGLQARRGRRRRSEEHTSELQSRVDLVCRLLLE